MKSKYFKSAENNWSYQIRWWAELKMLMRFNLKFSLNKIQGQGLDLFRTNNFLVMLWKQNKACWNKIMMRINHLIPKQSKRKCKNVTRIQKSNLMDRIKIETQLILTITKSPPTKSKSHTAATNKYKSDRMK